MSSKALKITWFFVFSLGHLVLSRSESISDYYGNKCVPKERHSKHYPTANCRLYLECSHNGGAVIKDCKESEIFNVTTNRCVDKGTSACTDHGKIYAYKRYKRNNTKYPDTITDLDGYAIRGKIFNENFNTLLRTRFLAVEDGLYKFSTKCVRWCKVWIRRSECGAKELVLEQKSRRRKDDKVEYAIQKPFNMTFGTFYYLEVVHVGDGKEFQFQLGVTWSDKEMKNKKIKKDKIPSVLLRLPDQKQCPTMLPTQTTYQLVRPTPTKTLRYSRTLPLEETSTITGILTSTRMITHTGILSPTEQSQLVSGVLSSHLISSVQSVPSQTSVLHQPNTTQHSSPRVSTTLPGLITPLPSNESTTTPSEKTAQTRSPKNTLEELAKPADKNYKSNESSAGQNNQDVDGMSLMLHFDNKAKEVAEKWNQPGRSMTLLRSNIVVQVDFPLSNYTFPQENISVKIGKEFDADKIFIPADVLVNENREFKRKVLSTLYLNLNEKIPRFFNVVKTENSRISGSYELISHVIASTAVPPIRKLQSYDIVIRLRHLRTNCSANAKPLCVFLKWNNNISSDGVWSQEGCIRDEKMSNENISVCRCNHLTHFGVLMQVDDQELSSTDVKALKFITYIGCALSLIAVCLTVLAIMCLPGARSERNFIHVNLAVAIGLAQITFLAGIDETAHKVLCTIVAALLHYFLLVAFSWMLIEGIYLHILIVKVFHDHLPKKRFYVTFCWGLPLVVVLLSVNLLKDGYGTKTSCWLSMDKLTIWTFSGPAILVMIINIIILCKVMKEINSLRTSDRRDPAVRSIRYGVRSTIILLPLLGLTWALGLIYVNESLIVFQYLFAIFNSLQGFFIFLFHCVLNTEVRKAFWRKVDLWFTTHNNPFGNNGLSRSSFKKSKDDPSSTCSPENGKKTAQRNGFSMYSFNDLTERERRKLSTTTASTCLDPWPHKLSLTPSIENGPNPGRFMPTLGADDIKYLPIYKQGDAGQKRISPNTVQLSIKVEDLNGNTQTLDGDCAFHKESEPILEREANPNGLKTVKNEIKTNASQETMTSETKENHLESPETHKSSEKVFENPETRYIQNPPQQNIDEKIDENEVCTSRTQQKPRPISRESFVDGVTMGIGGQAMNSADSAGHARKIEAKSNSRKVGTKL